MSLSFLIFLKHYFDRLVGGDVHVELLSSIDGSEETNKTLLSILNSYPRSVLYLIKIMCMGEGGFICDYPMI